MNKNFRPTLADLTMQGGSHRRYFKLTVVIATVALCTGCSVGTNGPLDAGEDQDELCAPAQMEGFTALGDIVLNEGDRELTFTSLELVEATDLTLEESYLMVINPEGDDDVLGGTSTVADTPQEEAAWERRGILENSTLGPGEQANVVVALSLPNPGVDGEAEAMRITYSDGTREFTADTDMRMILVGEEEGCS
ncbi:hypothetical protein ACX80Z_12715 [Arthrobacter sp. TMT4-20]